MKILLTGATGYIGKRLLPVLVDQGHEVICCVRDVDRFNPRPSVRERIQIIEIDFLNPDSLIAIPTDIDGAYYLIHSMTSNGDYETMERNAAIHFREAMAKTTVQHVIYLGGIINEDQLSKHLTSRKNVEIELSKGGYAFTALRAGIIIGSGSASFEIIRDLVEKLPVMVAPKWLKTKCQPIGITDVLQFLIKGIFNPKVYNQSFDIGGQDILTYKDMLLQFAKERQLKRQIMIVPVMTPRLSSYWLYFVTSVSYHLARSLVDSMKVEVICQNAQINELLDIEPISYREALNKAFLKIEKNEIVSSWKDSFSSSGFTMDLSDFIKAPSFGCFVDKREQRIEDMDQCIQKIWSIGGQNGWYYGNWLWQIRGYMDKLVGGVGLRRGRTNLDHIDAGDTLDFWRVLYANKESGRLLLYAEMKLPGEAWLEFKVVDDTLVQTATFRPLGLMGRMYWYSVLPFHGFIFSGMLNALTQRN